MADPQAYLISNEDMKDMTERAGTRLASIKLQGTIYRLSDIVRFVGGEKELALPDESETYRQVQRGLGLYFALSNRLLMPLGVPLSTAPTSTSPVLDEVTRRKRDAGLAFAMYGASAMITSKLEELVLMGKPTDGFENVKDSPEIVRGDREDVVRDVLVKYAGVVVPGVKTFAIDTGLEFAHVTRQYFQKVRDIMGARVKELQTDDFMLEGMNFDVAQEYSLHGLEALKGAQKIITVEAPSRPPMTARDVVGNTLAKKQFLRWADRQALYNVERQMNPVMLRGGFPWSVLGDGLPGTGKTTLEKLYLSRLETRVRQIRSAWPEYKGKAMGISIDASTESKWYGEQIKELEKRINQAVDPTVLASFLFDDFDTWVKSRSSSESDVGTDALGYLLNYMDGVSSISGRGSAMNKAFTNEPATADPAFRQRFHFRFEATGPERWDHFADLLHLKLDTSINSGLIPDVGEGRSEPGRKGDVYVPFALEDKDLVEEHGNTPLSDTILRAIERCNIDDPSKVTWADLGRLCRVIKDEYPRFTGRPIESVSQAVRDRNADFDIPEEWFDKPELFMTQPLERQQDMLGELYVPVTGLQIVQELDRYYLSELRFAEAARQRRVADLVENQIVQMLAAPELLKRAKEMGLLKKEGDDGP